MSKKVASFIHKAYMLGLFCLILVSGACSQSSGGSNPTPSQPKVHSSAAPTELVSTLQIISTPTVELPPTIAASETLTVSQDLEMPPEIQIIQLPPAGQPTQSLALPNNTSESGTPIACNSPEVSSNPSGIIASLTMAEDVSGEKLEPVNPTDTYAPDLTIHAVAAVVDAPSDTQFKAEWYITNAASGKYCNQLLDTSEVTTDGTRNLHFQLTHEQPFPQGAYRLQVYVNSSLDQVAEFYIK